jgi:hypothetical protein
MRTPLLVILLLALAISLVAQTPRPSSGSPGFIARRDELRQTFQRDYRTEVRAYPVGRTINRDTTREPAERLVLRYYVPQDCTDKYGRHDLDNVSERSSSMRCLLRTTPLRQ